MPIQLWETDQVVEFFQARGLREVNKKWVQNRCDRGDLPYTLVGNRRKIRSDLVEKMYDGWLRAAS
jgi:hypothetical protein